MERTFIEAVMIGGPFDGLRIQVDAESSSVCFPVVDPAGGFGQIVYRRDPANPTRFVLEE